MLWPARIQRIAIVSEASKFLGVLTSGAARHRAALTAPVSCNTSSASWACSAAGLGRAIEVGDPSASLAEAQPGDLLFFEPDRNGAPQENRAMSAYM